MLQTEIAQFVPHMAVSGFQVPKGMLQTIERTARDWKNDEFQVPKGMLQTHLLSKNTLPYQWFQVPKGMLQTVHQYYFQI